MRAGWVPNPSFLPSATSAGIVTRSDEILTGSATTSWRAAAHECLARPDCVRQGDVNGFRSARIGQGEFRRMCRRAPIFPGTYGGNIMWRWPRSRTIESPGSAQQ